MKQTVSNQMDDCLNVTGAIPVLYDNFVFQDLEQSCVIQNHSLDRHYNYVISSPKKYRGISKHAYGKTIRAIKTIVTCKTQHPRRTESCKKAIAFLHQDMKMSPDSIRKILFLFGVKLSISQLLEYSEQVFAQRPIPRWVSIFTGGI